MIRLSWVVVAAAKPPSKPPNNEITRIIKNGERLNMGATRESIKLLFPALKKIVAKAHNKATPKKPEKNELYIKFLVINAAMNAASATFQYGSQRDNKKDSINVNSN
jgi:hypothetical protein